MEANQRHVVEERKSLFGKLLEPFAPKPMTAVATRSEVPFAPVEDVWTENESHSESDSDAASPKPLAVKNDKPSPKRASFISMFFNSDSELQVDPKDLVLEDEAASEDEPAPTEEAKDEDVEPAVAQDVTLKTNNKQGGMLGFFFAKNEETKSEEKELETEATNEEEEEEAPAADKKEEIDTRAVEEDLSTSDKTNRDKELGFFGMLFRRDEQPAEEAAEASDKQGDEEIKVDDVVPCEQEKVEIPVTKDDTEHKHVQSDEKASKNNTQSFFGLFSGKKQSEGDAETKGDAEMGSSARRGSEYFDSQEHTEGNKKRGSVYFDSKEPESNEESAVPTAPKTEDKKTTPKNTSRPSFFAMFLNPQTPNKDEAEKNDATKDLILEEATEVATAQQDVSIVSAQEGLELELEDDVTMNPAPLREDPYVDDNEKEKGKKEQMCCSFAFC